MDTPKEKPAETPKQKDTEKPEKQKQEPGTYDNGKWDEMRWG